MSGYGSSYKVSWWGDVNAPNGWGSVYPFNAEGSCPTVDSTLFTADSDFFTADNACADSVDVTPPVITLIGSSTINLTVGDSYTELGATATDDVDGNLTSSITTSGSVDTLTASTYIITYSVSDSSGNSTSANRSIVVSAAASGDTPGTVTNVTWHYLNTLNTRFPTDSFGMSLTYDGNTYLGFTYTLSNFTDPDGLNPSAGFSRQMRIDTASIGVGTFIADDDGVLLDSADNHTVYDSDTGYYRFPPFAAFATPIYMKIVADSISLVNNPFSSYPIYKLEQDGGYIKVTEIITSGDLPVITGNSLSDGFNLDNDLIPLWAGNIDHASLTSTPSLLGQAIYGGATLTQLTEAQAKQITQFFAGITNVSIDTWYSIGQTFKVVETEADPDTIIHNMTNKTGAEVKYTESTVLGVDFIVLIKGGTHNPKSTGSRQILTVGEVWNDRDIIKY